MSSSSWSNQWEGPLKSMDAREACRIRDARQIVGASPAVPTCRRMQMAGRFT